MSRFNITLLILFVFFLIGFIVFFITPAAMDMVNVYLEPGLSVKNAAVIAFFITIIFLVIVALAAGDGLFGEIQFMIGAFFILYVFFWLMISWIF